jgi:hypothetical protein
MNDELNKVTVIVDVERAQQEALVLPEPAPATISRAGPLYRTA